MISASELAQRRQSFNSILGTMGAEGEIPPPDALAIFERYASGETDMEEMKREVHAWATQTMMQVAS